MPQPIYLPEYRNPWEVMLPSFLSQMILQSHAGKLRKELMAEESAQKEQEFKQEQDLITQTEPKNVPEGLYTYRTPKGWGVVAKPKNEGEWSPIEIADEKGNPVKYLYNKKNPKELILAGKGYEKPTAEQLSRVTLAPANAVNDPTKHQTLFANDPRVKELLDKGMIEVKTPAAQVNVNMPDTLTPKIKSDLQTKIIESDEQIDAINEIDRLFKDKYLTYEGSAKGTVARVGEKAGVDLGTEYLGEYTEWKSLTDKQTLAYRKLVTGVAGGEKEMTEIKNTYINTDKDSPTMYRAKAKAMRRNAEMVKERAQYALENFGVENFKELPLNKRQDIAKKFPFITKLTLDKETVTPDQEADNYLKGLK